MTLEQFQHDVGQCYVITIMRMNTPLAGLFESAVWALLPYGSSSRNGYPYLLSYGSVAWKISASFPETQQGYISGYEMVLSRTWNGADGLFCLGRGTLSHNLYSPFHFTVPCLSSVSSHCLGEFAPQGVSLGMLAAQRLGLVTKGHLGLATAASAGCPGTGGTKGLL